MIFNKIGIYNFPKLFNIIADIYENNNIADKSFNKNISQLYNQISINMEITCLSFIEYFYLKNILNENAITEFKNNGIDMQYIKQTYPDITQEVRQVIRAFDSSETPYILPTSCIKGSCNVKFTGKDLAIFLGLNPMIEFFIKIGGDNLQNKDHTFNREYMGKLLEDTTDIKNEELSSFIINTFLNSYYKSLVSKHEYVDLVSDFSTNIFYSDKSKLVSINNAINISDKNLLEKVTEIKNSNVNIMDDVNLTFSMNTTFIEFLNLYNVLPKHSFTAIESFRVPFKNLSLRYTVAPEDNKKIIINNLRDSIDNSYSIKGKEINHALMIEGNANIHYIISLSLNDINRYIEKLNENEYTKKSYKLINSFGKSIYNMLK